MSREELRTRVSQEVHKRLDDFRSVAGLPAKEPKRTGAVASGAFFLSSNQIGAVVKSLQSRSPETVSELVHRAQKICTRRFDLLGYRDLDFGSDINWSLDPISGKQAPLIPWRRVPYLDFEQVGDHKVTWELSRHQHLTVLARAWRLSGEEKFLYEALDQFRDWRRKNPYPKGIHWTSALEVGFRALSWLWLRALVDGSDSRQKDFRAELETALGQAALYLERFLSTYFSPNTHLLGEALALYAIGSACPGFEAAKRWSELGRTVLIAEAKRQFRSDGAYFEQSTYYHVYALDMYLHFLILADANRDELPADLRQQVERMADWLWQLSAGGLPPRFGDDDGGRLFDGARNRAEHLLDPLSTAAVLFRRPEYKLACGALREETHWLLGPDAGKRFDALPATTERSGSTRHDGSGFHLLAGAGATPSAVTLDCGPLGALSGGHGHADALSLQWVRNGRYILLDPGTGRYPEQAPERNQLRGTAAHSTASVEDRDQADPAGPFGWSFLPESRTETFSAGSTLDLVVGVHFGYERLTPSVTHKRWVVFWKHGRLFVRDCLDGAGSREAAVNWRVGADFSIEALSPDEVVFRTEDGDRFRIAAPRNPQWSREIFADDWSPCYGRLEAAPTVRFRAEVEMPCERASALGCGSVAEPVGNESVTLLTPSREKGLTAYLDRRLASSALLCFAEGGKSWRLGPMESDAQFLAYEDGPGEPSLTATNVSQIRWDGKTLCDAGGAGAERIEWTPSKGATGSLTEAAKKQASAALGSIDVAAFIEAATVPI